MQVDEMVVYILPGTLEGLAQVAVMALAKGSEAAIINELSDVSSSWV